jgi:hypothetical protein
MIGDSMVFKGHIGYRPTSEPVPSLAGRGGR